MPGAVVLTGPTFAFVSNVALFAVRKTIFPYGVEVPVFPTFHPVPAVDAPGAVPFSCRSPRPVPEMAVLRKYQMSATAYRILSNT